MTVNFYRNRTPLRGLRHEFNRAFDLNGRRGRGAMAGPAPGWVPPVDIREDADRFVVYADIPGFDPKAIDITFDKGVLTIKGERAAPPREELAKYSHLERPKQSFERRFRLPDAVDPAAITARGEHGVLEVVIGKKPAAAARRITIE